MPIERKLAAVMFTDIVGFTKIMTKSEDTAISILKAQDDIFNPLLEKFSGNLLKKMGDGLLVEFSSAVNAVDCALNIQSAIKEYNQTDSDEFHIRIGIHLGDVLMLGDDILGDGVNIASRIEPLATPDGICITEAVQQSIKSKLKVDARRISEVDLKHIDDKYTIYKIPNVEDEESLDNHFQYDTQIKIKDIINEPINKIHLLRNLIVYSAAGWSVYILIGTILGYMLGNVLFGPTEVGLFSLNSRHTGEFSWGKVVARFLGVFFLFVAVFQFTKREAKIIFNDIRNVYDISNFLILQMGYKYIEKKGNKLKFYKDYKITPLSSVLSKFKFYKKIESISNTLYLKFDGNFITIEGRNESISTFVKEIKNISKSSN